MRTRFVVYLDADKTAKAYRNSRKTKKDIANEVGCSREYICSALNPNYCTKNRFSFEFATRFAQSINTTVSELEAKQSNDSVEKQAPALNYGDILERWLSYTGMSSATLCRKSHMSIDAVKRLKNGHTITPRDTTIMALANAFSVSYQDFLSGPPKVVERALPYDTEVDEPAEETCAPDNECDAIQVEPEPVQEVIKDTTGPMPEWLAAILKEEITDAHAGFKAATKAADKKCYASIVLMHAALYTRSGSH